MFVLSSTSPGPYGMRHGEGRDLVRNAEVATGAFNRLFLVIGQAQVGFSVGDLKSRGS